MAIDAIPDDLDALRALVSKLSSERDAAIAESRRLTEQNDQLRHLLKQLQRAQFGQAPLRTAANDPDAVRLGVGTTVEEAEKMLILKTLEATSNNKTRAAEILGISLKTLHNKLKEYGSAAAEATPGKEEVPSG